MNFEQEYNLALQFFHEEDWGTSRKIFEKLSVIEGLINSEVYAQIQLILVMIYEKEGDFSKAKDICENFSLENSTYYFYSQELLALLYLETYSIKKFIFKFSELRQNPAKLSILPPYVYHLFDNIITATNPEALIRLQLSIAKILNILSITQKQDELIAHYTTPTVAYLMLDHKNQKEASKLRLNPTDFMNDPTEGILIDQLFSFKAKQNPQFKQHKSFIGCFTLHHDSLNQFRLYGKENQREASGVSLVLNRKQIFENQSNFTFIIHNLPNFQEEPVGFENTTNEEELSKDLKSQQKSSDLKLPLYRCIYFDPDSGLTHVAQREEWTFCRQAKGCTENGWDEYKLKIDQVNKSVRELIADIQKLIQEINPVDNSDEAELIEEILLPLRYLIKHYAFKEEQECRTIYITQWNDSRIQLDPKLNRVYVDYQSILPAMEKIFLSVGALHHESALQYLGQTTDKTFIVKRSHNPFRT